MSKKISKRQQRVDKIIGFLRTYEDFAANYGKCAKSIDLFCHIDKQIPESGTVLMQDIIRAYKKYNGGEVDGLYSKVCKDVAKRDVYLGYLFDDWKRAIDAYYSCQLSIPGLTKDEALAALRAFIKLVK